MSNTMPFESEVANITHEQWLYSEAQKMLETRGLGAENLCTWQGSVYGAFDLESDDIHERTEQDWGLSQLGENGEEELPSLIIQSCWAHEYNHMFNEMQEWIKRGAGVVQMAILLKWTLEIPDQGADPVLHSEIEVFEYTPRTESQYKRTFHEKVSSTEEKELQSVKITAKQLFAGHKPRGRGASYALSLSDLWYTALDIFDAEVEEWNAQGQLQLAAAEGFGQVTPAAQGSGEHQADEEEYDTDEDEGSEVNDDFQNGAEGRLRVSSTSVLRDERSTAIASASASVFPTFQAADIAGRAAAEGSQVEEDIVDASRMAHTGRAVDENALTLEFDKEGVKRNIAGPPASTTQHPQATNLTTTEVVTTTQTTTIFEADSEGCPEDTFDLRHTDATARAATQGNGVRSTQVHKKISTEGGTVPVTESHTEYTVTEHTSKFPSGSYERFQESITESSYTHEESVEEVITPNKTSHLEVSITQDSGSANTKTETFEVTYDQTLTLQQSTSNPAEFPCPHCLSKECCHGPQSPLRHLPRDFMSAGVIGPFSWFGFVVYLSLSTLQPVPKDAIEKNRPILIERIQEFTKETHVEFPPEDVGPLLLITIENVTTTDKTIITTETTEIQNRNRGAEVPEDLDATGAAIQESSGGGSFTRTTKTENRPTTASSETGDPVDLGRGIFQSPEPKYTPFGPWDTTFNSANPTKIEKPPAPKTEHNGLGITIEPQRHAAEKVVSTETAITQEATTTNKSGKIKTGVSVGHGQGETLTTGKFEELTQAQAITTENTKATRETLPKVHKTADISVRKNSTTTMTEETTRTVERHFVIPETITERKTVTVVEERSEGGHLPRQTVGSTETAGTVNVTEAKETKVSQSYAALLPESDGEEEQGDDIFVERKLGSRLTRPVLNRSFTDESVQSFDSFESSNVPGPEEKSKLKRSRREKMMKVVTKALDAVKHGRRNHKANTSLGGDMSASETTLAAEETTTTDKDFEGRGEHYSEATSISIPMQPGDELATIPPKIVSKMQQKLNLGSVENAISPPTRRLSKITRRQSGSSTFPERPKSQLQRTNSTGGTLRGTQAEGGEDIFSRDVHQMRKGSQSTTTTRRLSDDSTFSHVIVSENESIGTAPSLTPGLGGERVNVKADKLTRITGMKTTAKASESGDDTDSGDVEIAVESEIHIHDHEHAHTHESRTTTTSGTVVHASTCQYLHSTGLGLVQCDCGGEELIKYHDPPPPERASTADLMAQLQSLLTQLQGRTGKVVVPHLGVNMTCEITETEEEEVEVEVEVRVKYKSKKSMEHVGFCERTRGLLGAGGTCPIMEEMMGRA